MSTHKIGFYEGDSNEHSQLSIFQLSSNITLTLLLSINIQPHTHQPLCNRVRYNSFGYNMDQCWTPIGHFRLILLYNFTFYSCYITVWIANTEIGLDPNNSVIKRLWCTLL